jgi:hypothetical protein
MHRSSSLLGRYLSLQRLARSQVPRQKRANVLEVVLVLVLVLRLEGVVFKSLQSPNAFCGCVGGEGK